ncbi:MAG: type VI secretion system membrane subunit TssM, partial [Pseudomonadota bacterium]
MRKIWYFLTDGRSASVVGFVAMAVLLFGGAALLELALAWAAVALVAVVLGVVTWRWLRRRHARRESEKLGDAIGAEAAASAADASAAGRADGPSRAEVDGIRDSMLKAIATIKGSKMGMVSGARALYELPWYMIIGNPAAGKSSAITHSGLQFPVADGHIVQGVGGTRNCDWFFTTDGILLDTAGRYAVVDQHREEWFGFLDLLKKYRKRAPINGIIIAVSIAELRGDDPETGIKLAHSLRKRVQDLIERLEVFAPVYVVFTKVDLIAGFGEFFAKTERSERERVWGATMPYKRKITSQQLLAFFDQGFDELCDGLKEMSLANMAMQRRERMPAGVFTFPLEFATIRPSLRAFLATLFEENPFQFKPVFRGFYFTSALQEGQPVSAQSQHIAKRFALQLPAAQPVTYSGQTGYFLLNLFRKVIFADKELVAQYASKSKMQIKYGVFFASTILLGASLGGWSWSYLGNRQLVSNVQADLDKVIKLQDQRLDLQSRLEALDILQDRIEQLDSYRKHRPWSLRMGLYQGELLDRKLREEYFSGVKEVMLKPVAANLEALLAEMNANADQLQAVSRPAPDGREGAGAAAGAAAGAPVGVAANPSAGQAVTPAAGQPAVQGAIPRPAATQPYLDASPTNVEDAYNALKTYLMLADKSHAEPSHLNDQLTRYWRGW